MKKVILSVALIAASGAYALQQRGQDGINNGLPDQPGQGAAALVGTAAPATPPGPAAMDQPATITAPAAPQPRPGPIVAETPAALVAPQPAATMPAESADTQPAPVEVASVSAPISADAGVAAPPPAPAVAAVQTADAPAPAAAPTDSATAVTMTASADPAPAQMQSDAIAPIPAPAPPAGLQSAGPRPVQDTAPPPQPGQIVLASSPAPASSTGLRDGTYTGPSANAYYGRVQVAVTVSGGRITNIKILDYPNDRRTSRYIASMSLPILKEEVIQAQSANVDLVSGATLTSMAFRQSVYGALSGAGA